MTQMLEELFEYTKSKGIKYSIETKDAKSFVNGDVRDYYIAVFKSTSRCFKLVAYLLPLAHPKPTVTTASGDEFYQSGWTKEEAIEKVAKEAVGRLKEKDSANRLWLC